MTNLFSLAATAKYIMQTMDIYIYRGQMGARKPLRCEDPQEHVCIMLHVVVDVGFIKELVSFSGS